MLGDICYEKIMDNYWYANYLGLQVVMMKSNGYVNVTKLCSDGGKQFKHWKELKSSKAMLEFYENKLNNQPPNYDPAHPNDLSFSSAVIPSDEQPTNHIKVIYRNSGGKGNTYDMCRGTYMHPLLIPHIASWIHFEFAYNVSVIIQDFAVKYYKIRYEGSQAALYHANAELSRAEQSLNQLAYEKMVIEQQHSDLKEEYFHVEQEHISASEKINEQRSKMYHWSNGNAFVLLKKNNDDNTMPYYAIRCRDKNAKQQIKRLQKGGGGDKYPNSSVIFQTANIPSGINLFNTIKKMHGTKYRRNHFSTTMSESELLTCLGQLCNMS